MFFFCALLVMVAQVYALQTKLPVEFAIYDLNNDGELTTDDALVIYDYILSASDDEKQLSHVDFNKDGIASTMDVVMLYVVLHQYSKWLEENGPSITNPDMEWGAQSKRGK